MSKTFQGLFLDRVFFFPQHTHLPPTTFCPSGEVEAEESQKRRKGKLFSGLLQAMLFKCLGWMLYISSGHLESLACP